jgi:metal-responsive CopG/Arc/MetJ family transcriptional regulator
LLPICLYICILKATIQYILHGGGMKVIRTLMIDSELLARVDEHLEKNGKNNRSEFISECIREKLEKNDKKRKTA